MKTSLFTVALCLASGAYLGAHFSTPTRTASAASARLEADVPVDAGEPPAEPPMVTLAPTIIIAKRTAKSAQDHICNWDDVRAPREMSQGPVGRMVRGFCGGR